MMLGWIPEVLITSGHDRTAEVRRGVGPAPLTEV
jgi:hypothetical protein